MFIHHSHFEPENDPVSHYHHGPSAHKPSSMEQQYRRRLTFDCFVAVMLASVSVFVYLHSTVLFIVASAIYVSASLVGVVFVVRYINHPNTVLRPSRVSLYTPLFALGFMYVLHQIAGPPLTLGLMITWIIVVAGGVFLLARYLRLYLGEYSPRRSDSHQH